MGINKDQIKGRVSEAEGKLKEVVGRVVGNDKLEVKGKVQEIAGKAQAQVGDAKKALQDGLKKNA